MQRKSSVQLQRSKQTRIQIYFVLQVCELLCEGNIQILHLYWKEPFKLTIAKHKVHGAEKYSSYTPKTILHSQFPLFILISTMPVKFTLPLDVAHLVLYVFITSKDPLLAVQLSTPKRMHNGILFKYTSIMLIR